VKSGVSIKYTDGRGRSYPDMASMLQSGVDELKDEIYADVERAVGRETCPVHNQKASVRRTQSGFAIEACCEQFSERANTVALDAM
jgi:hypothetical protein